MLEAGRIREIVRYPVKSMAGCAADSATLGWFGVDGDRRFAFRRVDERSGMPWLTASRLPQLVLYQAVAFDESTGEPLPTRVRTPSGSDLDLQGAELKNEIAQRFGNGVDLMKLNHGIFDDGEVSIISLATIEGIGREAGVALDRRRFRANIVLETEASDIFLEDAWIGGQLIFGDTDRPPVVSVTKRDERCVMVNIDPETAEKDARVMKTIVRLNDNFAGVYAKVVQPGTLRVGDRVRFLARSPNE